MSIRLLLALLLTLFTTLGCDGCADECADGCPVGFSCQDGTCVDTGACPEECASGEVCAQGTCIPEEGQCTSVGEVCRVGIDTAPDFFCLDQDNAGPSPATCVERCDANGQCASGGLCFFVSTSADTGCATSADCDERRVCQSGGCRSTVCLPSECDGFVSGAETCTELYQGATDFPNGGQCVSGENDSNFCVPAGPRGVGEVCEDIGSALQRDDYSLTCQSGLACVDSVCRTACGDSNVCTGDQECLLADEDFVDVGTGFCGLTCTPFEVGSCGDGQTCFPVSPDEGTCIGAGTKQAYESCQPGGGECADGTLCVSFEEANAGETAIARCQPWCNVSVAPAGDDGVVGDFEQAQRDATCPQPPTPGALFALVNAGVAGVAVDLYFGEDDAPVVTDLAYGRSTTDAGDYLTFDAGNYTVRALEAGAPATDPPLFETTVNLQSQVGKVLVLTAVAGASDELSGFDFAEERVEAPVDAVARLLHAAPDAGPVDMIVVPPGDDLSDPTTAVVVGSGLEFGDLGPFVDLTAGTYDLLAFPAGDPRTDRANAVVTGLGLTFELGDASSLIVTGTVDINDAAELSYVVRDYLAPPALGASGPRFTCVSTGDDVLGFCQQECGDDPAVFAAELCEGSGMGCAPVLLSDSNRWRNLCGPVGEGADGDRCAPARTWGECGEGLSCLEYGNAAPDFDPTRRGRCRPLCDTTADLCGPDRACNPISYGSDYAVGECGYSCEPGDTYADPMCPDGLGACKPIASLRDPEMGMIPIPREEQPFCSAAGTLQAGEVCSGSDCVGGTECMFDRSAQTGFVPTLASQYFGTAGSTPTCRPQCNPFDGGGPATCAAGETCLFNFPWSAEVGHCAPIVEEVAPEAACSRPGESCGEDSICVVNNGANVCLRFCQFLGDTGEGALDQSTCPSGLECSPFVADVGVCVSP